jgi:hypothetical protein
MLFKEAFNFYKLLCGNNVLKQKTLHSSMAHVYALLYNAAKQTVFMLMLHSIHN